MSSSDKIPYKAQENSHKFLFLYLKMQPLNRPDRKDKATLVEKLQILKSVNSFPPNASARTIIIEPFSCKTTFAFLLMIIKKAAFMRGNDDLRDSDMGSCEVAGSMAAAQKCKIKMHTEQRIMLPTN
jgi:hypothetical protein